MIEYLQQKARFVWRHRILAGDGKWGSDSLRGHLRGLLRGRGVRVPEWRVRVPEWGVRVLVTLIYCEILLRAILDTVDGV